MNLASYITVSRIFLILPIIVASSFESRDLDFLALLLFILASVSDYLDGYIARKTNSVSELGGVLDLIADKLLVVTLLIFLSFKYYSLWVLIPSLIIIFRELMISLLRYLFHSRNINISVSKYGKIKTTCQMISICFLIIFNHLAASIQIFTLFLLGLAAFLSITSMYNYLQAWKQTS